MSINVTVVDQDGIETTKTINNDTTLSSFVPQGFLGLVNGREESGSTTLREGDRIKIIARSGKAGC